MSTASTNTGPRPTQPTTTVTVIDPKILAAMDEIKADLKRILERTSEPQATQPPAVSYFPRGYF